MLNKLSNYNFSDIQKELYKIYNFEDTNNIFQTISKADQKVFMAARLREGDATAMAHSIEVRYPLIDHQIIEFISTLPQKLYYDSNRVNGYGSKMLLYDAFKKYLPEDFPLRKKKGFHLPFEKWLKNDLRDLLSFSLFDLNNHNHFNKTYIDYLYKKWQKNGSGWRLLYAIMIFNLWYKNLFEDEI